MDKNQLELAQAVAMGVAQAMGAGQKIGFGTKAPAVPFNPNQMHGPNGLFGIAGADNNVLSLRIAPYGISSVLKASPSVEMNPLYPYITGFENADGVTEPSNRCSTCISGETEACYQTAQFGYICRETKTLEPSKLIERTNAGDLNLSLINDILNIQGDVMAAMRTYNRQTVLNIQTAWAMLEVGMLFQNALAPMYWQGNPANNVGDGYMEFPGLDILISTNKVDAVTGARCDALNSDVKDYNYNDINLVQGNQFRIVRLLSYLEAYVYNNAMGQSLLPVDWVWVMRPELWYELTEIWPVAYLTTRGVTLPASNTAFLDATRINDMRDQMREGNFLSVNGRTHRVVLDTGIFVNDSTNNANLAAGEYASNIYLLPLTYLGGRPATYLEHKDYRVARLDWSRANGNVSDNNWTDDGRFRWVTEQLKFCYTVSGSVEPRIILKTPQLAGRLNNVKYVPEQYFRDWDPDSDYFFKGGVSLRNASALFSDWNLPGGFQGR